MRNTGSCYARRTRSAAIALLSIFSVADELSSLRRHRRRTTDDIIEHMTRETGDSATIIEPIIKSAAPSLVPWIADAIPDLTPSADILSNETAAEKSGTPTNYTGGVFCKAPTDYEIEYGSEHFQLQVGVWNNSTTNGDSIGRTYKLRDNCHQVHRPKVGKIINVSHSLHHSYTGECGPNCRPSCVTLLLDLQKLRHDNIACGTDEQNTTCEFQKATSICNSTSVFEEHPQCNTGKGSCLGPIVFDDSAAFVKHMILRDNITTDVKLDQCDAVPDDDMYYRFRDWKLITPLSVQDCKNGTTCFNNRSKIYFEYCNIVEEDQSCDECHGTQCGQNGSKVTVPFPTSWTTFVVSASIPYETSRSNRNQCDNILQYDKTTGVACFLQRVEIYYPTGCPHCHDCPLLSLGDTFGPLETVGFGHSIQQPCAACDQPSETDNERQSSLDCQDLLQFSQAIDCHTGERLGLPSFNKNQCSFGLMQGNIVGQDTLPGSDNGINVINDGSFKVGNQGLNNTIGGNILSDSNHTNKDAINTTNGATNQNSTNGDSGNNTKEETGNRTNTVAANDQTMSGNSPSTTHLVPIFVPLGLVCLALNAAVLIAY